MKGLQSLGAFQIGTGPRLLATVGGLLFLIGILTTIPTTAYAQLAFAHVLVDGTVNQDSGNITVRRPFGPGDGEYCIGVTGGAVSVAVVSLDSFFGLSGNIQAGVFFASVCSPFPDAQNILVVTRPLAQDGGFPGEDRPFYIVVY